MNEIEQLLEGVPQLESWKTRIDVGEVREMMKSLARDKTKTQLSAKMRDTILRLLIKGSTPPKKFLADIGVTAKNFRDPARWILTLFTKEPEKYLALLKQRVKMLRLGALAGPVTLNQKIGGDFLSPCPNL